jgi:hypothetical protein
MSDMLFLPVPDDIKICFDGYENGDYSGKICSIYEVSDLEFETMDQVIPDIMDHLDMIGRPECSETIRSFKKKRHIAENKAQANNNGKAIEPMRKKDEVRAKHGDIGTFVVHVKYRQNASMQGEVIWTETGDKRNFRSAYELLKLMDSAVQPDDQDDIEIE